MSGPRFDLPGYPGRGVAVHRHHDGRLEWIYFLTGRSDASRQRVLQAEADRVTVVATQPGQHDPLRHYSCVRVIGHHLVVGNGDHVDHLADGLHDDGDLAALVDEIDPEPDSPILTPRIAVIASEPIRGSTADHPAPIQVVSVRAAAGRTERRIDLIEVAVGTGVLIHTYGGTTTQVTTDAVPRRFDAGGPGTDVAGRLWHALDPELRVALAVGLVPEPVPTRVLAERSGEPGGR